MDLWNAGENAFLGVVLVLTVLMDAEAVQSVEAIFAKAIWCQGRRHPVCSPAGTDTDSLASHPSRPMLPRRSM